jgi:hypothetical protein
MAGYYEEKPVVGLVIPLPKADMQVKQDCKPTVALFAGRLVKMA